ncbi:G-protein coupled receptor [Biomphalaria glabrata]|nr:G-protein coupled receptor [Biomphalaria glabrata]
MDFYQNTTVCETTVESFFPLPYGHDADPLWRGYEMTMANIVTPITSFVGVVGNTVNMIVLSKGNWNKSSTCLIFSLAVADTMYLLGANNISMFLYSQGDIYGFKYTEANATLAYYFYLAQVAVEITGKIASMFLPCLISLDRLIAVCLPLRYSVISTPRRVNVSISVTYLFAFAVFMLYALKFSFILTTSPVDNSTLVGLIIKSSLLCNHYFIYSSATSIISTVYGPASVAFTLLVCIAVGVMVYLQSKKRKSLLGHRIDARELAEHFTGNLACFTCFTCFKKDRLNDHLNEENELSSSTSESVIHITKNVISKDAKNAVKRPEIPEL